VTDITVKHEPDSGAAVIEIRGADLSETRFRLRDPASDKYLTRRGWTKTASFLPKEAVASDGVMTLTLDADLARKIPASANLSLEQPAAGFKEVLTWPGPAAAVPVTDPVAETPTPEEPVEELFVIPPLLEPTIMDEHLHADEKPADSAGKPDPFADNDNDRPSWMPAAIAAVLFFVLGMGLGYLSFGSSEGAVKEAQQTAAMQLEKQKWEFERQLAAAKQEASAQSLDKAKASDTTIAKLASERDTSHKTLAAKQAEVDNLEKKLADANSQIAAVKAAAGDEAKAQIAVLDQKIGTLTGELDKSNEELASRDQLLRDTQAKLTEANEQIAAVKDASQKEAEALNAALEEKTDALTKQVEQAKQQAAQAQAKLKEANEQITAVKQSAQTEAEAQSTSLTEKINALTAENKASEQKLAEREKTLRDAQAKLSVANVQIDALKIVAGKSTEAGLEKQAMSEKVAQLTADLDKAGKALEEKEQALAEASAKLRDADTKLAAAQEQQQQNQQPTETASNETANRLQQERDIYAEELKTMTTNFTALQEEKAELQKEVAELQTQMKDDTGTTPSASSKAIWGATAIDQTGTIYALQNQTAEKAALDNVTAICRGKSKYRCEALTTYSNACFSVARFEGEGPAADNYAYFVHKDWKKSAASALERCQSMGANCTVRFTACSPDGLSKPAQE
jgi:chromosome segregation ATPase